MPRCSPLVVVVALLISLVFATSAHAECAWVLMKPGSVETSGTRGG